MNGKATEKRFIELTMRRILVVCLDPADYHNAGWIFDNRTYASGSDKHRSNGVMFTELNLAIRDADLKKETDHLRR